MAAYADASDDAFLGGALHILQPKNGFRAGVDSVLLAAAVPVSPGQKARILDVGAGAGVVGLALARRIPDAEVTLLERNPALAALCRSNIERNDLAERVRVIEGDVSRPLGGQAELANLAETFDHVVANPPYHTEGRGTLAVDPGKAKANAMAEEGMARWARFMAAMARPAGVATIIHKADALFELLKAMQPRFGALVLLPIYPRATASAHRLILSGTKGSRAPSNMRPSLILHGDDGRFLPEVNAILREGAALPL